MRPGERGADPVCVVPHVVIDPARDGPLRLHDGQYAFQAPPAPGLDAPGQLAFVERYLISRTDPFSKTQGLLIERYFAHLRARIEDARIALCDRLGPLRSVFDYRAFAFAAPRPLPRCLTAEVLNAGSSDMSSPGAWMGALPQNMCTILTCL